MRPARIKQRKTQWVTWVAVAAIAGLLVAVVVNRSETEVAARPYSSDAGDELNAPTPREVAGKLREDAFAACRAERWADCEGKLDDAKRLDPAGEDDKGVRESRRAAADGRLGRGG